MQQIMSKLQKYTEAEYTSFIRVLFGQSPPTPVPKDLDDPEYGLQGIEFAETSLNDSQKDAIKFAILSREVALIHGPPGVSNKKYLRLPAALTILDWENTHVDRTYTSVPEEEPAPPSVWTFKYLRGQYSRAFGTLQSANDPFRPPSSTSTINSQSFPRRTNAELGGSGNSSGCKEGDG